MKLIATLGSSRADYLHNYVVDGKKYETNFSFQALAKHYEIGNENVIIIGTPQTKEKLGDKIGEYKFIDIEDIAGKVGKNDTQTAFGIIFEIAKGGKAILDLTQGLRHIPMMILLSSIYAQHQKEAQIEAIFYAKTLNSGDVPTIKSCDFEFISLVHYIDISNSATIIETFITSAVVPALGLKEKSFKQIADLLRELSNYIFANNLKNSIKTAKKIRQVFDDNKWEFVHFDPLIENLLDDLEKIIELEGKEEFVQLYFFGKYVFGKNLLLQSLSLLYEAMLAFLESESKKFKIKVTGKDKNGNHYECLNGKNTFERRNCLKKALAKGKFPFCDSPVLDEKFKILLKDCDIFRNAMAHAFTGEDLDKKPKNDIQSKFDRFTSILGEKIK